MLAFPNKNSDKSSAQILAMASRLAALPPQTVYRIHWPWTLPSYSGPFPFLSALQVPQSLSQAITSPPYSARQEILDLCAVRGKRFLSPHLDDGGHIAVLLVVKNNEGMTPCLGHPWHLGEALSALGADCAG